MAITGSNIFGTSFSTSESPSIPYSSTSTSVAGQLMDKLKNVADNAFLKAAAAAGWAGAAADVGQRNDPTGLVNYQNKKPAALTNSSILAGWTAPTLPTLPAFPVLPSELKVDMAAFKTNVDERVQKLKDSWFTRYLPEATSVAAFDTMLSNILGSSMDTSAQTKLDTLESELKSALTTTITNINSDINTYVATLRANLNTRRASIDPKVQAAIDAANDDTADIAFARARDQIAREGLRQENEAYAEMAARGFALPNGVLLAQLAMARQATLDGASKIAAEEAMRAQERNVELAKQSIDAWLRAADFDLRADIEAIRQALEPRLRHAQMEMEANREKAKQAFEHLGLRLDFTKFASDTALKYRALCVEGLNNLISAYASLARNEMDYLARIADAQRSSMQALVDYYRVGLSHAELGFKAAMTNNENDIKWASVAGDFIGRAAGNHVAAATASVNLYAQIAAMALSGLNGVASQTTTG